MIPFFADPTVLFPATPRRWGAGELQAKTRLSAATAPAGRKFFNSRCFGDRWLFAAPDENLFSSPGPNHTDSSARRYSGKAEHLAQHCGNDQLRRIRETVGPNLRQWGFIPVGSMQKVSVLARPHTPSFTLEEYQASGWPYGRVQAFSGIHQRSPWHKNPDFSAHQSEEWCHCAARNTGGRPRDAAEPFGHFYTDLPTWVTRPAGKRRGPSFDLTRLNTDAGEAELVEFASRPGAKFYGIAARGPKGVQGFYKTIRCRHASLLGCFRIALRGEIT